MLLAVTLHEAAHGFVAWRLGDDTAYRLGRVSANPLRHIDPFGTIVLPALLLLSHSSFLFGYAKPVPVQFRNLRQPRRDSILVAAAGPVANLLIAVASAVLVNAALALPWFFGVLPLLVALAWWRSRRAPRIKLPTCQGGES